MIPVNAARAFHSGDAPPAGAGDGCVRSHAASSSAGTDKSARARQARLLPQARRAPDVLLPAGRRVPAPESWRGRVLLRRTARKFPALTRANFRSSGCDSDGTRHPCFRFTRRCMFALTTTRTARSLPACPRTSELRSIPRSSDAEAQSKRRNLLSSQRSQN